MGKQEDKMEAAAEQIVAARLGGKAVTRDLKGGPPGLRDFDVLDGSGGTTAGVEVSSVQVPAGRATQSWFDKLKNEDIGLSISWSVTVHEQRFMPPVAKQAKDVLNALHAAGVDEFDDAEDEADPNRRALVEEANKLGLQFARIEPKLTPPRLWCTGWGSNSIDPAVAYNGIHTEIDKPDNNKKLGATPTGATRILFLWVHSTAWEIVTIMLDDKIILPALHLPAKIDEVWVAVGLSRLNPPEQLMQANAANGFVLRTI